MDTDQAKLILKEETHAILVAAMEVFKATRCPVGLILNFKHAKLQWKRVVL